METILITGGAGFIGSHFIKLLLKKTKNYKIVNVDKLTYAANLKTLSCIEHDPRYEFFESDICNIRKISPIVECADYIVNFAAESHVDRSIADATDFIRSNVEGVQVLLDLVRSSKKIKRFLQISTDEVYGSIDEGSFKEQDPLNPSSPYAASKVAADRYAYAYYNTYHLPVAIIRPFNTYGPRLIYDVIPKFVRLALKNEPLTVYGTGEQSRDFTYVSDMVHAFLLMGSEKKAIGEAVNFGTGRDISINEIARKIVEMSESSSKIVHVEERKSEVGKLCCDYSKAKKLFGWEPKVSIDEGLKKTIEWAKRNK